MSKLKVGARIALQELQGLHGEKLSLPAKGGLTHLQFRRFAGCPICNLHLRSFIQRHAALEAAGIQELAVFHSSRKALLAHQAEAPFGLIADPRKTLYRAFGVEASLTAVLKPQVMWAFLQGTLAHGLALPEAGQTPLGLPADFLLNPEGEILALKYAEHANDHWSVDEVLALAEPFRALTSA